MDLSEFIKKNFFPDIQTDEQMAGIMLDMRSCWEVTEIKGIQAGNFFTALLGLLPADSIFCIETTSKVEEVQSFLQANKIPHTTKVQLGTIWPKPDVFHLSFNEQNMQQMAQLAESFAMPEICDHIHIYKDEEVLLEWFDAFWQPLYISKQIPESEVKDFCEKLGCEYCDGSLSELARETEKLKIKMQNQNLKPQNELKYSCEFEMDTFEFYVMVFSFEFSIFSFHSLCT